MKFKKIIFILFTLIVFSVNVYADSSINVSKRLNGVDNVDVSFSYEIVPKDTNPDNSNFSPNTFNISFDSNSVIEDRLSFGSYTLDFSNIGLCSLVIGTSSSFNSNDSSLPISDEVLASNINLAV